MPQCSCGTYWNRGNVRDVALSLSQLLEQKGLWEVDFVGSLEFRFGMAGRSLGTKPLKCVETYLLWSGATFLPAFKMYLSSHRRPGV
jgi:hypothetical protein